MARAIGAARACAACESSASCSSRLPRDAIPTRTLPQPRLLDQYVSTRRVGRVHPENQPRVYPLDIKPAFGSTQVRKVRGQLTEYAGPWVLSAHHIVRALRIWLAKA